MNILITGGYGFVGTQLLRILSDKEHHITVLDNLIGYAGTKPENVPNNHVFVFGDIRDEELVRAVVQKHDIVIHLAAITGAPACDMAPSICHDINVRGTKNIVDAVHLRANTKLVMLSTTSAYGQQSSLVVDETTPLNPTTHYGRQKLECEILTKKLNPLINPWIIFRPATSFGLTDRIRLDTLLNTLFYDALVDKKLAVFEPGSIRFFVHILDFCRALIHAVEGGLEWGQIYNIVNPALTMPKIDMIRRVAVITGAAIVGKQGNDPNFVDYAASGDKLIKAGFSFLPSTFELGYEQMLEALPKYAKKYSEFSTPFLFRKYLDAQS